MERWEGDEITLPLFLAGRNPTVGKQLLKLKSATFLQFGGLYVIPPTPPLHPPHPRPINKLVLCCVFFFLSLALMQSAEIRLAFTLFSFWENYFLLHLLWMFTPFLFTTLLGHIPVLFCSVTQQMVYTFFCLSVMSPSPSTSKCVSPPGTQFRLSAAHISPGPNPANSSFHRHDYSDFLRLSVDERICLSSRL